MVNRKPNAKRSWADVSGLTVADYGRAGVPAHVLANVMVQAHPHGTGQALFSKMGGDSRDLGVHLSQETIDSAKSFSRFHIKAEPTA